jgi:uncharacterized protein YndB with AHSA1/START domain
MTTKNPRSDQPVIRLENRYEADVADMWFLWTTKEGFESWWGPEGFRVEVRKLDLRVGGELVYDMIASAPEQIAFMKQMNMPVSHGTRGTFAVIEPHRKLGINHMIDFIPGVRPYENETVVEFFPEGKSVRMVITVAEHPDPEWTKRATMGLQSQLTKFPGALAARK